MSRESGSRPHSPPRRIPERLSVAVLASRWHIDYEHYARVLRARAQRGPCDAVSGLESSRASVPPAEDPSTLERLWVRAIESFRLGRGIVRRPAAAFRRAS
jgi:hypothetical protein